MPAPQPFVTPHGMIACEPEGRFRRRVRVVGLTLLIAGFVLSRTLGVEATVMIVALAAGAAWLFFRDGITAALRWREPRLLVQRGGFALGSRPSVVYQRAPKRVTDISACTVEFVVKCEEKVTYRQGTDTHTDTRTVFEQTHRGEGHGTVHGLECAIELDITVRSGCPTFQTNNNRVDWFVEVRAEGERLPRDSHRFSFDVRPSLDPAYQPRVQDS